MSERFVKFGMVGSIGFLADAGLFSLLFYLGDWAPLPARVVAFLFAATVTWCGNRCFTFTHCQHVAKGKQWLKFIVVALFSAIPNLIVFNLALLVLGSGGIAALVALAFGVLAGMVSNFLLSSRWVFSP
ncbi:GtrA family protein [Vibrio sp. SCSIO 43135]|nr:GtrA family protein [Vibrio sp. SCSIO 43135]USD42527.1 GtrA family protein [Vibrio sp. SCSIO 43135]